MSLFGMPGIGGSLGCCCVCGGSFTVEVLMNLTYPDMGHIQTIHMEGFDRDMCIHEKHCLPGLMRLMELDPSRVDWLPPGPLRQAFDAAQEKTHD